MLTLAAAGMPLYMSPGSSQAEFPPVVIEAGEEFLTMPPAAWAIMDPADSLYRSARAALRRNDYTRAAELFRQVRDKYPRSEYAPDAYYWEAFALYRAGGMTNLQQAREALRLQRQRHKSVSDGPDPRSLATRVCGALARMGDSECAELITEDASAAAGDRPTTSQGQCPREEDDMRIEALNAVLQMDADRAIPLLKRVLERRDACSAPLRRKAIFLVSQKHTSETETLLLGAARNDPDEEVREQAVFWLSQVGTERSVSALDSILRTARDRKLQEKAIFALSQVNNTRASAAIREFAERSDVAQELREQAIFWIGQQNRPENAQYLQTLYVRVNSGQLKEKIIFSLSQMGGSENSRWIMNIALDENEAIEARKQALFWAGQTGGSITDLVALYGRIQNREMKEQLIFVYSQRNDRAAVDKLLDIARNDSDREMRKKALFWLSQSNDPRVADLLQEIIDQ
jgi:tetratricopeptide (TPR) repeat protein